jgi:hypothetical protein
MKRRFVIAVIVMTVAAVPLFAADSAASAKHGNGDHPAQVRQIENPASDVPGVGAFPVVSKYQMPRAVPNVGCLGGEGGDPCQNDWGDGGWTQGGCNCSRTCDPNDRRCKPTGNNQCVADPNTGVCNDCVNYNC